MNSNGFSILFPDIEGVKYTEMSDITFHDLGLDALCKALSPDKNEQTYIKSVITNMTARAEVAEYRRAVFEDILASPELRGDLTGLFEKLDFMRSFGSMSKKGGEKLGIWYLLHRLDEFGDYIKCVEAMRELLGKAELRSEGLKAFRKYVEDIYEDSCFAEMKKDIGELKAKTYDIKSVTLGINVNERFDAVSMGLISINSKPFKKSGIVSNFADAIASKGGIRDSNEWNGDMHYHEVDGTGFSIGAAAEKLAGFMAMQRTPLLDGRIRSSIVNMPEDDGMSGSTYYLDKVMNRMLDTIVKKLEATLSKYVDVAVINISRLLPEFNFYIRFAEFIEKNKTAGFAFCKAETAERMMAARGFYNLRLAMTMENAADIVPNDLDFDREHTVYILTGANRGGKTTVTQAVGLLFVLAQAGVYVPAAEFRYKPVDCIYTHFPADEDKTIDLGRLGEECVRFKQIYGECTADSLLLLNESFSTTSFEEGYYIARDAVRAILKKQVRTIFNTHMHKLAADIDELNGETEGAGASSLIVVSRGGERSFRVEVAMPEGMSYARDIAEKYGVTYDMLTKG